MKRIRRNKKRNYTIFIILSALLLTAGYATFAQPLAHKLAVILPDGSRFGLWDGIINKDDNNGSSNKQSGNKNSNNNWNNGGKANYNNKNRNNENNNGNNNGGNGGVVNKQWDIGFINAEKIESFGSVIEHSDPSFNKLFATFDVSFKTNGDFITYDFTVKNMGQLDAKLEGYDIVTTNEENFKFEVEGLNEGDALDVGKIQKIRITTIFIGTSVDPNSTGTSNIEQGKITISLRYVQK